MRIVAGKYKSRTIMMPKCRNARPTKDRIREAVFNILRTRVTAARVLDLFAGSGAFGLEALSRGASRAVFVEQNALCIGAIRDNIRSLGIAADEVGLIKADVFDALGRMERRGETFDIIFADPPYHKGLAKKCLINLDGCAILCQNCLAVVEHHRDDEMPESLARLERLRVARYSDIRVSFYGLRK